MRKQLVSWIDGIIFETQDRKASESVVTTPRSGGGNLGTPGHDVNHLSFSI